MTPDPVTLDPLTPIPLVILTGFLGAGKTTLLNRILNGDHGLRIAVLVNDFGSINIDADLIVGIENNGDVISLANGCVCCSIRDDLMEAVEQVLARPERPQYVILEASGVADPVGIAATFTDENFRDRIRLDSITCVMDAEQVFAVPEQMRLKLWQIGCADLLILNKVDLVSAAQLDAIKSWLDEHFHRYRLIAATRCDVPLEILLSGGRLDASQLDFDQATATRGNADNGGSADGGPFFPRLAPVQKPLHDEHACHDPHCPPTAHHHHDPMHTNTFSHWGYETDQPLSLEALRQAAARLPVSIYRCKGVIHSTDAPTRRAVLQVVGKRVDLALADEWGERPPRTQIVAIGAHGSLDDVALRERFESCIATRPI